MNEKWYHELPKQDQEIVNTISSYFREDMDFFEKITRARLMAILDLEFDPVMANAGKIKARDVLRVTDLILFGGNAVSGDSNNK